MTFLVTGALYHSNMRSVRREEVVEVVDALDADMERLCGLSFDVLTTPEAMCLLERLETVARRLPVPGHGLIRSGCPAGDPG